MLEIFIDTNTIIPRDGIKNIIDYLPGPLNNITIHKAIKLWFMNRNKCIWSYFKMGCISSYRYE